MKTEANVANGVGMGVKTALMQLCPICGNKRCPHSDNDANACTGSNEPGQAGSRYATRLTPRAGGA